MMMTKTTTMITEKQATCFITLRYSKWNKLLTGVLSTTTDCGRELVLEATGIRFTITAVGNLSRSPSLFITTNFFSCGEDWCGTKYKVFPPLELILPPGEQSITSFFGICIKVTLCCWGGGFSTLMCCCGYSGLGPSTWCWLLEFMSVAFVSACWRISPCWCWCCCWLAEVTTEGNEFIGCWLVTSPYEAAPGLSTRHDVCCCCWELAIAEAVRGPPRAGFGEIRMTLVAIPGGCEVTGGGLGGVGWTTWLGRNNSGLKWKISRTHNPHEMSTVCYLRYWHCCKANHRPTIHK